MFTRSFSVIAMLMLGTGCAPVLVKLGVPRIQGQKALDFIAANPSRSALVVSRGDTVLASVNPDRAMTLASTAKVIIAIEYAYQVASGEINPNERVSLETLERFHVPKYDGGAQPSWITEARARGLISPDQTVAMRDVVRGMIRQSSNANAEWMLDRLSVDRVNARARALEIRQGIPMYYAFSSALLALRDAGDVNALRSMSLDRWVARAAAIHDSLRNDRTGRLRNSLTVDRASLERQRVWSERLPSAPARDYATLADRIASRRYFPANVQPLIEAALDANATAPQLETLGFKGGSSASAFTLMTYILRKDGTRTSYAVFFDSLTTSENKTLQQSLTFWSLLLDTEADFRERVAALGRRSATQSAGSRDETEPSAERAWRLTSGDRVRLALWQRPTATRLGKKREVTGRYVGGSGDTLVVDAGRWRSRKRILARDVLVVYHGREASRVGSASRQAVIGAAVSATFGLLFDGSGDHSRGRAVGKAALFGALEGALSGLVRPDIRWRLVSWKPFHDSEPAQ